MPSASVRLVPPPEAQLNASVTPNTWSCATSVRLTSVEPTCAHVSGTPSSTIVQVRLTVPPGGGASARRASGGPVSSPHAATRIKSSGAERIAPYLSRSSFAAADGASGASWVLPGTARAARAPAPGPPPLGRERLAHLHEVAGPLRRVIV